MDESGSSDDLVKTWTFIIRGGRPLVLGFDKKVGPRLEHQGGMTVWKMVGTSSEAQEIESLLSGALVGARVQTTTETEDEEMVARRHCGE